MRISEATATRPNDTTAYAAGDVVGPAVGDAMEFFSDGAGRIRGAVLIDSAAEATKPDLDLFLFDTEPTVAADNAAFAPTDAQAKAAVAVISFAGSSFKAMGANGMMQVTPLDIAYAAPQRKLFGVLVARNIYTPLALEQFTVRLTVEPD